MTKFKLKYTLAVVLVTAIPCYGVWLTKAPVSWPLSVAAYTLGLLLGGTFLPVSWLRRYIFVILTSALFVIEGAYFISYYLQNAGFNDAFFYHLSVDTLHGGVGEHAHLLAIFAALVILYNVLAWDILGHKVAPGRLNWFAPAFLVLGGLLLSPSLSSLAHGMKYLLPPPAGAEIYDQFRALQNPNVHLASSPETKPNIVLIYAESLEQRYFDEEVFPGLLPNLKRLRQDSIDFTNVKQAPGAGWTIGGMVASMCGYPLSNGLGVGGGDLRLFERFLPKATCLGDLLAGDGYMLSYIGGADAGFSGKDKFLSSHGYSEIIDRDDFISRLDDPGYMSDWGAYDDTLFEVGIDKFRQLSAAGQPFVLTFLTLDTHHPNGWASKSCKPYPYRDNSILNAVYCSDQLISDFVGKIRASEFSDETLIVFLSDHLAQRNRATPLLESSQKPERLTFFINEPSGVGASDSHPGTHFDVASTLLDYLGYEVEGQFGFGRSIMNQPGYLDGRFGDDAWWDKQDTMFAIAQNLWDQDVALDERGIQFGTKDLAVNFGGQEFNLRSEGLHDAEIAPTLFVFDPATLALEKIRTYPFSKGVTETSFAREILGYQGRLVLAVGLGWQLSGFSDPRANPDRWSFFCGKPGSDYAALGRLRSGLTIPFQLVLKLIQSPESQTILQDRQRVLNQLDERKAYGS